MATNSGDLAEKLAAIFRANADAEALVLLANETDPVAAASAISAALNALYRSHATLGRWKCMAQPFSAGARTQLPR
jgi:hypothetical protein